MSVWCLLQNSPQTLWRWTQWQISLTWTMTASLTTMSLWVRFTPAEIHTGKRWMLIKSMKRCAEEMLKMHDWVLLDSLFFFFKVSRQVSQCNCPKRFQVEQISANRYRVSLFSSHRYWVVRITHSKNWCMITRLLLIPIMFFFFVCCSLEIPSSWGWFVFFEAHWWSE